MTDADVASAIPGRNMATKRTPARKLNPVSPQVMKLATLLRRSAASSYKRAFGFSNGEWRLVGLLGENGPMLQNALVEALGQDKGQTSRAVARLVDGDLIVRERTPGGVLIQLSSRGETVFQSMRELIRERNSRLLEGLDANDRSTLLRVLRRMTENAQALLASEPETDDPGSPG
jgi:DNA-binding MarR family transcriptional regulator